MAKKDKTEKQETNFIEIILRNLLLDITIFDDDDNEIIIEEINYDPMVNKVYIKSGDILYKMSMDRNYNFLLDSKLENIFPNKEKIKGKKRGINRGKGK